MSEGTDPAATPGWRVPPPLTERVLEWLPVPRPIAVAAWAAVPLVSPLGPDVEAVLPDGAPKPQIDRFGSVAGPLGLALLAALIVTGGGWSVYGPIPPLAALPFLVTYLVPIMTFVWVDLVLLVELDRLGRQPLRLEAFAQDRAQGLGTFGAVASTGFVLLLVAVAPVLVAGGDEPVTFALSIAVVIVASGAFVLSMWRLHGQMAAAKDRQVRLARRLHAEAYRPIREDPTLAVLEANASALGAARALDERATSQRTWPIDEEATRFAAVVVTSVLTSVIVRALFAAVGL